MSLISYWPSLVIGAVAARTGHRAWRQGNRRVAIDSALVVSSTMVGVLVPASMPATRYSLSGILLGTLLIRMCMFAFSGKSDKYERGMLAGLAVFILSIVPVLVMKSPVPLWAKWLAMGGLLFMVATSLWPLAWMGRIWFSARRLRSDLKHRRPPREADERTLGIDLSMLRNDTSWRDRS